MKIFLEEDLKD